MKIQDLIPVLGYTTQLAVCTSFNMLYYGTKEELLNDTNNNIYLIVCNKDIKSIDLENNAMRIEI